MHLSPRELDKLVLHQAGVLAQKRLARGLRLNHPEAVALLATQILELIRDGRGVYELMLLGQKILGRRHVMRGVPELIDEGPVVAPIDDGVYDLLALRIELNELLRALDIPAPVEGMPEEDVLAIGRSLDVRYVLCSRLTKSQGRFRLQLLLHDLSGDKSVRKWPSKEVSDFVTLLRIEDRFFSTLGDPDLPAGPAIPRPSAMRVFGKYATVAFALASGAGLGYLAYNSKQSGDTEYRRFQSAQAERDASAARNRVREEDVQAKRYGLLSGAFLLVGVAVWTF